MYIAFLQHPNYARISFLVNFATQPFCVILFLI